MSVLNQTEFNNIVSSLMSNYNSQTTAHAQYLIALSVGILGILAILIQVGLKNFIKQKWIGRLFLYIPLSFFLGTAIYLIIRSIFWAWMTSEVPTIPNNATVSQTTPIYAIQQLLTSKLVNETTGWTALSYSIDQKYFAASLGISIIVMLVLILGLDFAYVHKEKDDKWHGFRITIAIIIGILIVVALLPAYVTPPLQAWINPSYHAAKGLFYKQIADAIIVITIIVLPVGYFIKGGSDKEQKSV